MENINIVLRAVSSKSTMKVLECILLTVQNDTFIMTSNDLDNSIETAPISAHIEIPGKVALDAKLFADIVRKMPEADIVIDCDHNFVTNISSGRVKFKIVGIDGDEFPGLEHFEKVNSFSVSSEQLKKMIRRTIFAVATDSSKPVFKGELFEISDFYFNIVAVDGFRISFARTQIAEDLNISKIVPGKALNELVKILPDDENADVKIWFSENHVLFEMEKFTFMARLLNGEFFNYKQIFTDDYATKVVVDVENFLLNVERVILISEEANKSPVYLSFQENVLSVSSQTGNGSFNEDLPVETEGPPIEIAFNPWFLMDVLKNTPDKEIELYLNTPLSACVLKNSENSGYKFLIVPLRTAK
jgi:DNA polymerase-3 subunit beta